MKNTVLLYFFATGALAGTALACSQSPPPLQKAGQDQSKSKGDDDDGKGAAAPAAPAASSAAPPPAAAPAPAKPPDAGAAPAPSGSAGTDPLEAAYDQCMTQCVGANPVAVQIQTADNACFDKCSESDPTCLTRCEQLSDQECQSNAAACGVLAQCDDNCSAQVGF